MMLPLRKSSEVCCAVAGQLLVHIVDATANVKGFEHAATKDICALLQAAGIPLSGQSPVLATSVADFAGAFKTSDWNVLLLVSHGRAVLGGPDHVRLADLQANWYLANAIDMNLQDKAVFLCVCEGACEDATYVLLRDQLALLLAAPKDKLLVNEAKAFFPAVFRSLLGKTEITPEDVRSAVAQSAVLAGNKMTVLSAVGFA